MSKERGRASSPAAIDMIPGQEVFYHEEVRRWRAIAEKEVDPALKEEAFEVARWYEIKAELDEGARQKLRSQDAPFVPE